ncbi:DUF3237 domain-containing protein [Luteolibacter marinus]|uniref:DUF3237 domain-containing protein n=1 Tax=Luteolibacter marinus TaxID=2776705 RepID=UPI001D02B262|nr:DUF3237 domain-containing protein [Luteolibacter marinus]
MMTRGLCLPFIAFSAVAVAEAGIVVELEEIDTAPPHFTLAMQPPWVSGGQALYRKFDSSTGGPPAGIYRNGTLIAENGEEYDDATLTGMYVIGKTGTSYAIYGMANHMAGRPNNYYDCIYQMPGGTRIIDRNSVFPGYPTPLPHNGIAGGTMDPSSGNIAFYIRPSNDPVLPSALMYWQDGSATLIAKQGDTIPGRQSTFNSFNLAALPFADAGEVIFQAAGTGGVAGIYRWNGSIQAIVDDDTPAPGGGVLGTPLGGAVRNGSDVAFSGGGGVGQPRIYKMTGGQLSVVADTFTPVPGGTGDFASYTSLQIKDGSVVFIGSRTGTPREYGIYTDIGGKVEAIVDVRTDFGGRVPKTFHMNPGRAWVEDSVFFQVNFEDYSDAVFKATFRSVPDVLESKVEFSSATSGTITVATETGETYTLKRSTTLDRATAEVVSTHPGNGTEMQIPFGPPSPAPPKMFYWVEQN